jgi:hypothetical protein
MGRQDYDRVRLTCHEGLCEDVDLARPNQVTECLNVWAPNGVVEQRPGYVGAYSLYYSFLQSNDVSLQPPTGYVIMSENAAHAFTAAVPPNPLVLGAKAVETWWYYGFSDNPFDITTDGAYTDCTLCGFAQAYSVANTNLVSYLAEYWNGTEWKKITCNEIGWPTTAETMLFPTLSDSGLVSYFSVVPPIDWALKIVNTYNRYWIRFTLKNSGSAALSAATQLETNVIDGLGTSYFSTFKNTQNAIKVFCFPFILNFNSYKKYGYISFPTYFIGSTNYSMRVHSSRSFNNLNTNRNYLNAIQPYITSRQSSIASVVEYGEHFINVRGATIRIVGGFDLSAPPFVRMTDSFIATVEDRDEFVGVGADYDPSYIPQLTEWPSSKFIMYFNSKLWAADEYIVRWSAPAPAHKVWPTNNYVVLAESDNSPITGINTLGDNVIVYKRDSIWTISYTRQTEFGTEEYSASLTVPGTGTISNSSICKIGNNHVFLSESGIYKFNGQSVEKATLDKQTGNDRLSKFIKRINPQRAFLSTAIDWKIKKTYLLAVPIDASYWNNAVICWNYDNDSWWIWDDFEVSNWISDEDENDLDVLYFMDYNQFIYKLEDFESDNGAPFECLIKTSKLDLGSKYKTKTVRELAIDSHNISPSINIEVLRNGETIGNSGTYNLSDSLENKWGTASWGSGIWEEIKRRVRRIMFRDTAKYFQLKISNGSTNKFKMNSIEVGVKQEGNR